MEGKIAVLVILLSIWIASAEIIPCPAGFFCPLIVPVKCSKGYYCPANSTAETLCPPKKYCPYYQANITIGNFSDTSEYGAVALPCPKGYFCLDGTVYPKKCLPTAVCNEGSKHQEWYLLTVFDVAFVVGVFILYSMMRIMKIRVFIHSIFAWPKKFICGSYNESEMLLMRGNARESKRIDLKFVNVNVGNGARLESVHGRITAGRVLAVMGPSGCGKSTVMDAVLGNKRMNGTIVLNGQVFSNLSYSPVRNIRRLISFMPQYPPLSEYLSVRETIEHTAKIRTSREISYHEKKYMVDRAIKDTGLEPYQNKLVNELSGGQQRRVSIAEGISFAPVLCVLDEPTSGLDTETSLDVIKALKTIASNGVAVVAVLHSPTVEMLNEIDDILFIVADPGNHAGKSVYFGPQRVMKSRLDEAGIPSTFENPNQVERLFTAVGGEINNEKREYIKRLRELHERQDIPDIEHNESIPMPVHQKQYFWWQLYRLLRREALKKIRNPWGAAIAFGVHIIAGLFLGIAGIQSQYIGPLPKELQDLCPAAMGHLCQAPISDPIVVVSVLLVLGVSIAAMCTACGTFGNHEWILYLHDERGGVNPVAFFLAKVLGDFWRIILCPFMILGPYYLIAIVTGSFWLYYGILVGVEMCCYSLAYIISLLLPLKNHVLVGVVVSMCFCLLSGLSPSLSWVNENLPIPLPYLWDISYARYATEAFCICETEYYGQVFNTVVGFEMLGFKQSDLGLCMGMIFTFAILFYLFALAILLSRRLWNWSKRILRQKKSSSWYRFYRYVKYAGAPPPLKLYRSQHSITWADRQSSSSTLLYEITPDP